MKPDALLERPFGSYSDLIRSHARERPDHIALIEVERRASFAALDAMMDRIAASLQRDGIRPGECVAVCAATSLEYAAIFLGALRAGIAVAPLPPSATADSLMAMITNCEARLIFIDSATANPLAAAPSALSAQAIHLDRHEFEAWLVPAGTAPRPVAVLPDAAFNIIYSSGTTGTPKGIVQPHAMRWVHAQRAREHGYGPDAVTLIATPLYSNTTLVSFFPAVVLGGTAVLMAKFDARAYLALAQTHRATHTMLVPVQYARLMALPDFDRFDLSAFRMKFCTSAPFAAALKADVLARWPGGLIEYYGMTEGGGTVVLKAHERPDKLGTVGQPAPGHDIRLIDADGREAAPGEAGEVVGHSPAMMRGYHRDPERTREAEWHSPDGKRFIRTGDVGRFDGEGFLTLMDRKKDMIISGGFNVYPSDLEAVLATHADVAEAAVVGIASARWGETPIAFVVLRTHATATADGLRDWANARLGKTQRLAALRIVDSLPRSAIGKVLKRELRDNWNGSVP